MRQLSLLFLLVASIAVAADLPKVSDVVLSRQSFNPSIQQTSAVSFVTSTPGRVSVQVIDRDGYVARHLSKAASLSAGRHEFKWDGRNDESDVVPDEAWSFRIELETVGGVTRYFPAATASSEDVGSSDITFDRSSGIIRYVIAKPSRVHVQAGCARVIAPSKSPEGPVLRTVVDREPRIGGSIIETWNGLDQSGTIYVPDLPNFVIGVAATPLPENSVITTGNRARTFVSSLAARTGQSLLSRRQGHAHHQGLTALEDRSPSLTLQRRDAVAEASAQRSWRTSASTIAFDARVSGPSAASLVAARGSIQVFVDGARVREVRGTRNPETLSIDVRQLSAGRHILAVNWASPFGPVAVNAVELDIVPAPQQGSR